MTDHEHQAVELANQSPEIAQVHALLAIADAIREHRDLSHDEQAEQIATLHAIRDAVQGAPHETAEERKERNAREILEVSAMQRDEEERHTPDRGDVLREEFGFDTDAEAQQDDDEALAKAKAERDALSNDGVWADRDRQEVRAERAEAAVKFKQGLIEDISASCEKAEAEVRRLRDDRLRAEGRAETAERKHREAEAEVKRLTEERDQIDEAAKKWCSRSCSRRPPVLGAGTWTETLS